MMFKSVTISEGKRGALFRKGVFNRELPTGRHRIWPMLGDEIRILRVTPFIERIDRGRFWSNDMVPIGMKVQAKARIRNVSRAVNSDYRARLQEDLEELLVREVLRLPWREIFRSRRDFEERVCDRIAMESEEYGIAVEQVSVVDVRLPRAIRRKIDNGQTDL